MKVKDLFEADSKRGTYTAAEAKRIGDCAIIAISIATDKSWDQVWDIAKDYFTRTGLMRSEELRILKELGYKSESYWKMPWAGVGPGPDYKVRSMTVNQAEIWLKENDPNVTLICQINAGVPHAICYKNGKFHNVQGFNKAKIRLCTEIMKS